jgi:hypothetical protein
LVDPDAAQIHLLDGVEDEMGQMACRHPIAQIGRQDERCVVINIDQACSHAAKIGQESHNYKH